MSEGDRADVLVRDARLLVTMDGQELAGGWVARPAAW
jgi:hypothetical protein